MASETATLFASCGDDIKLWDTKDFQLVKQYNYHQGNVKDVTWTSDNKVVCSTAASGDKIVLCDWKLKEKPLVIDELGVGEKQICARVSYSGKKIYSGGVAGDVNVWDRESKILKKSFLNTHPNPITCMALNKSETFMATGSSKGSVVIRNLNSDVTINPQLSCKGQAVRSMIFSPWKHSLLGMALDDGSINLWDSLQQQTYHNFSEVHKAPAMDLSFSPFNDLISASVGLDKQLIIYDVTKHKAINKTLVDQPLTSVTFVHDGVSLFVGSSLGRIYQFDLRSFNRAVKDVVAHSTSVQKITVQNIKTRKSKNKLSEPIEASLNVSSNRQHGRGDFDSKPQEVRKQTGGFSNGFPDNKQDNSVVNSTPSITSRFHFHNVDDLGGIISPVRDEVFGNYSNTSNDGTTIHGMSDTAGSYTDDILSPISSNQIKPQKQRTPHSGVQIHTRTSPHPLRESNTFQKNNERKELLPTKGNLAPSLVTKIYADKTRAILKTPLVTVDDSSSVSIAIPSSTDKPSANQPSVVESSTNPEAISNHGENMTALQYQAEYLRVTVKEIVDELGDEIRHQNNGILTSVVKLLIQHEDMIRDLLAQRRCNINEDLLMEVERLKEENERLRRKF